MKSARALIPVVGLVACGLLLVGQVRTLLADPTVWPPDDYVEYWAAGRLNLEGKNPYSAELLLPLERDAGRDTDEAVMMWNPPWTLAVAMPLGALPARVGQLVWFLFGLASLGASAYLLGEAASRKWLPFAVTFTFLPTFIVLQAGQITFLVVLGLAGFLWCVRRGHGFAAGLACVLVAVKPHLGYLLWPAVALDAVVNRRASVLLGGVVGGAVASGIAVAFNPDVFGQYFTEMSERPPAQWVSLTLGTVLRAIFGAERFWLQFVPVILGLAWFMVRWTKHRKSWNWNDELPRIVLVSFVTSPYGAWHFDLVVLLVPLIHRAIQVSEAGNWRVPLALFVGMNLAMLGMNLAQVYSFWFGWVAPFVLLCIVGSGQWAVGRSNRGSLTAHCPLPTAHCFRAGPATWFFLALFAVMLVSGRANLFRDPGTFWHVRTGEIVLGGNFTAVDPFTFTFGGRPWSPYSWLGEVGMALAHAFGGFDALLVASAALIAGIYTFLFARILRSGLHWSLAAGLAVFAVAASAGHFHARPHLISLALFAGVYAHLQNVEAGRSSPRTLWWLVPLFVVWANTHGGVLAGYGTVALAFFGWAAFRLVGLPSPLQSRSDWLTVAAVGSVTALTPVVNPYGLGVPRTWLDIMTMKDLPRIIKEHSAVDPSEPSSWGFFLLAAVYAVALVGLRAKPRVTWLLPIVWFALGCERVRHAPLFAVAATLAVAEFFPSTIWAKLLTARPDFYVPVTADTPTKLVGSGVIAFVIAVAFGATAFGNGFAFARLDPDLWPTELLPALHREAAGRRDVPIFNEYEYGGFLIYFAPEYRPFVDDRCEVFGNDWLAEFVAAGHGDAAPAMAKWEKQYPRFDLALVKDRFGPYFANHPGWELVATDGTGSLYRRR